MKLYKNVDIQDLPSILENGLLSMDECGNYNWEDGNRSDNETNVVYLFKPIIHNTFPQYGMALIEVEVDAQKNEFRNNDCNKGLYDEYVTNYVSPSQITNVYIPEIFKTRVDLPTEILNKVKFCKMNSKCYVEHNLIETPEETLKQFAITSPLNSTCFNYFRGIRDNNTIIDVYDVDYDIEEEIDI